MLAYEMHRPAAQQGPPAFTKPSSVEFADYPCSLLFSHHPHQLVPFQPSTCEAHQPACAAALGTPTIALFGPTDPGQWAPRGDRVSIFRGFPCECTNWKQVQACNLKPCLTVSVDDILHQAEWFLNSQKCENFVQSPQPEVASRI